MKEFRSYSPNVPESQIVSWVDKVKVDNVLVLDESLMKKYNLSNDAFSYRRNDSVEAYLQTNSLGITAKDKFNAVLIPSAEAKGGMVLHAFGDIK